MTERGGLRSELLGGGIVLTSIVCLVTTTTEGVHNLLFPSTSISTASRSQSSARSARCLA